MASDSDTEEFFDASEELSSTGLQQRQCPEPEKPLLIATDKESKAVEEPESSESIDSNKACHPSKQDIKKIPDSSNYSPQALSVSGDSKSEQPAKENGKTAQSSAPPPRPVAPPRRKKQQKKEALAKSQDAVAALETKVKPPRPSKPPAVAEKEAPVTASANENQPFITVNANATDMDEVIMKGSSLDVVQNRDLDEYKSPTGSKTDIDKNEQGMSTPLTTKEKNGKQNALEEDEKNIMQSMSGFERPLSDIEILEQVIVKNLDTGETIPLSLAEDKLPKCTNPLALQIMRLTSEYSSDTDMSTVCEDGHISDSSVAPSVKLESKRKKLKKFLGKTVQKIKSVADEVKARREETSSSDEDETQDTYYIKMKTHKAIRERRGFEKIQLLQDLSGEHIGAIWIMKFSLCGRLLAAAGQDNIVRVWVLKEAQSFFEEMRARYARAERGSPTSSITSINSITSAEDDNTLEEDNLNRVDDMDDTGPFKRSPFCTYHGHTSDVLDISWSKNYFMLSSSMDKTVRLWHISRHECLCCFQHVDFVTAICFHPKDDRYFLSGSLDGKIRLWNIPEKKVVLWNEIDGSRTSLITAANFCQNGKLAVVGTYDGRCIFYDTERLKYHTQLTVRSTRGKNARGRKISGIEPMPGEEKVLITSNDSRVRLYDLKDHSLYCKYKGANNSSSQIKASFSHDGQYIVCGSEDHFVYIWRVYHDVPNVRKDRNEYYESFSAHDDVVTAAVFAPIPSVITSLADPDGKEKEAASEATNDTGHCEVLATADWSGSIKLFVNR